MSVTPADLSPATMAANTILHLFLQANVGILDFAAKRLNSWVSCTLCMLPTRNE